MVDHERDQKTVKAELALPQELVDSIADKVIEKLTPFIAGNGKPATDDTIFNVQDLAEYLHVTPKWIHERTHLKNIPFYKLSNKQLRFRKRDIDKWLDSLKTPAINQFTGKLRAIK